MPKNTTNHDPQSTPQSDDVALADVLPDLAQSTDELAPEAQRDKEPPTHYQWFLTFLELGPSRSIRSAYNSFKDKGAPNGTKSNQKSAKTKGTDARLDGVKYPQQASNAWKLAAIKWGWLSRAQQWDLNQAQARADARQTVSRQMLDEIHAGMRVQLQLANQAAKLGGDMLKWPIVQRTVEEEEHPDGIKRVTIYNPSKWDLGTAARVVATGNATLQRMAGLLTEYAKLDDVQGRGELARQAARLEAVAGELGLDLAPDDFTPLPAPSPTEARQRENAILDQLEEVAAEALRDGKPGAFEQMTKVLDMRWRLNGYAKPYQPGAEQTDQRNRDFSDLPMPVLKFMEAALAAHREAQEAKPAPGDAIPDPPAKAKDGPQ